MKFARQKKNRSILASFVMFCCLFIPLGATHTIYAATAVINRMDAEEKSVYLTFDDGPDTTNTLSVMNTLLKYDVSATFFFTGKNMKRFPAVTKQIYDNGFVIGLHGYDHSSLVKMSAADIKAQINNTNTVLENITGERSAIMRPPYGAYNNTVASTLSSLEITTYMWMVDPRDWSTKKDKSAILRDIKVNVKPGAIILMHTGAGQVKSSQILPELIEFLKAEGYQIKALPNSKYKSIVIKPIKSEIMINKQTVDLETYLINNSNYIRLRDLAASVSGTGKEFEVIWNEQKNTISIFPGEPYTVAGGELSQKAKDGNARQAKEMGASIIIGENTLKVKAYTIKDNAFIDLLEIAEALGIFVSYDADTNTIILETEDAPLEMFPIDIVLDT